MKRIILIILTALVSLFIFNYNVEALNSDATATCVYSFPPDGASSSASKDFFTGATITYSKGVVSGTCNKISNFGLSVTMLSGILSGQCEAGADYSYFIDEETGNLICPTLWFYEKYSTLHLGGGTYTFKVFDDQGKEALTDKEVKKASVLMQIKPSSASKINQGTTPVTAAEAASYMNCDCGSILLKTSGVYFNDETTGWNNRHAKEYPSFDIANMKECPSTIYYQVVSSKLVKVADWNFDTEKTTEVACADTIDLKAQIDEKKNDTNFIEQLDIILPFCDETSKMWKLFGYLINALKILVPALIIVMGSVDLGKAVVAQNEDEMKKGTQLLIKRIIAGIIIFFIPTIVSLIFNIMANYSVYFNNGSGCISCITKPWGCD
jgi:hypothetical protein